LPEESQQTFTNIIIGTAPSGLDPEDDATDAGAGDVGLVT
jgi:hypothetical protein